MFESISVRVLYLPILNIFSNLILLIDVLCVYSLEIIYEYFKSHLSLFSSCLNSHYGPAESGDSHLPREAPLTLCPVPQGPVPVVFGVPSCSLAHSLALSLDVCPVPLIGLTSGRMCVLSSKTDVAGPVALGHSC